MFFNFNFVFWHFLAPFDENKGQNESLDQGKNSRHSLKLDVDIILLVSKYFEEKNRPIKKLVEGLLMHIGISTLCPS